MKNFFLNESGQDMVEYGLIIALIAVAVLAVIKLLIPAVEGLYSKVAAELYGTK